MINFLGFHIPRDGYGVATIKIAEQLQRLASDVHIVDMRERADDAAGIGEQFGKQGTRVWETDGDTVALCTPDWLPYIKATHGRLIAYTMFEATRLPHGWVDLLNTYAAMVFVPCTWNIGVFRANGVIPPMRVVKWGVDTKDYPFIKRTRYSEPYTFLWSGTPDRRKGYDVAYRAFWLAFHGDQRARLIMHFRAMPRGLSGCDDTNVEIINGVLNTTQQRELLERVDCYVFPSRGEGWGNPPREAAATGLPTIVTNWGGLAEDVDYWAIPIRVSGMSHAEYGWDDWGDIGEWAEPDINECAERMRWCYEHRTSALYFGYNASMWLERYATWEHTAAKILSLVGGGT